jgi:hypothetical protein
LTGIWLHAFLFQAEPGKIEQAGTQEAGVGHDERATGTGKRSEISARGAS